MGQIKTDQRPDHQLGAHLIALVYSVVAMALSLILMFLYPQSSLYFITLIFFALVLCLKLAISLVSASEQALTYGGFANEILKTADVVKRIENVFGDVVIENSLAQNFCSNKKMMEVLEQNLYQDKENLFNFERLKLAYKSFKTAKVLLALRPAGEEKFFEISLTPLFLKKEVVFEKKFSIEKIRKDVYFLWSAEDKTASQNMEKIFEDERRRLYDFIQHMPVGFYIADSDHKLEYVNETFAAQLSRTPQSLLGENLENIVQNNDRLLNIRVPDYADMAFFKNGLNENTEMFVLQNNYQEDSTVKIRALTLKNLPNDEKLINRCNDFEDELLWLFDQAPNGIVYVGKNLEIENINRKAKEILGLIELKKTDHLANMLQNSDVASLKKAVSDFEPKADSPRKSDLAETLKIDTKLKSGKMIQIFVRPRHCYHQEKERFDGLVLYIADTTEQKDLELQFAQAQKMQAMGQMAGGVAHDFNNLLTAMIGFCDLLLQRHGIGDPSFADLIQIKQNANRAAALVRQLLAFSRKQPVNPKYLDLTENFTELSHLLKRILGEQISLAFYHGSDLGFVRVDPFQFSQVMINLVVNAKDAMNGKGRLKISTRTERLSEPYQFGSDTIAPGDFVVVSVSDTGCGIPEENLTRIFEPFFSTKQNVVGSGTGLGLAMVYGIVRQTEGFIKVESELNVGTTFSVYLPRYETSPEEQTGSLEKISEVQKPVLTSVSAPQTGKMILGLNVSAIDDSANSVLPQNVKILFVEDEDSVRAFGVRALKKKGFNVAACACAENALELIDQGQDFDLVVTDMVMPGLSGADLAKAIKSKKPAIKIILASGYSEEIARRELAGSQDFEFIAKPYSLGDLTKKVFETLKGENDSSNS